MHLEDPKMAQTIIFTKYFLTEFMNKTKQPDFSDLKLMHIQNRAKLYHQEDQAANKMLQK